MGLDHNNVWKFQLIWDIFFFFFCLISREVEILDFTRVSCGFIVCFEQVNRYTFFSCFFYFYLFMYFFFSCAGGHPTGCADWQDCSHGLSAVLAWADSHFAAGGTLQWSIAARTISPRTASCYQVVGFKTSHGRPQALWRSVFLIW